MNLMKKSSRPCPPCEKAEAASSRTRRAKLRRAFHNFKDKIARKDGKTRVKSGGVLKGQWRQEDLPKIVKKIVDKNLGLTNIEIYDNEIRWHCEIDYYDLFPKKKGNGNPSKREDEKRI